MKYRLPHHRLILASMSPARRQMLSDSGLDFACASAPVDEESLREAGRAEGISAEDMATALAEAKALRVSQQDVQASQATGASQASQASGAFVIGADQLLECGHIWYGKPEDMAAATATLKALQGKTHRLITAAVIMYGGRRIWHHCARPAVSIRGLDKREIEAYLAVCGAAALQTPGSYQIEGIGAQIITRIDGCPYATLGLPLLEMLAFLREHGLAVSGHDDAKNDREADRGADRGEM